MFTKARIVGKNVNPVDYFAESFDRGTADFVMSVSALRNFGQSPSRFLAGYNPPDSDAKEWGRLFETGLLSPELFSTRYAIQPGSYESEDGPKAWNGNAKICRAWKADRLSENKEIVTKKEVEECDQAISRFRSDSILNSFVTASDTQVWVQAEWQDEEHGASGEDAAVLAEVNNTFGERHLYLVAHPDGRAIADGATLEARKVFHVSPFCEVRGHYAFRFHFGADRWLARIDYFDDDRDAPLIATAISGAVRPLDRRLARALLDHEGIEAPGEVVLHAFPRMLGYVFNPVSFWVCHDGAGRVAAVLAEVNNTFGERHHYIVAHPDGRSIADGDTIVARKVFHVSPFCEVRGRYAFRFRFGPERWLARIDSFDDDRDAFLECIISHERKRLAGVMSRMNL